MENHLSEFFLLGLFSLTIVCLPLIFWILLTNGLFKSAESKRIEENITKKPSTMSLTLLGIGLFSSAFTAIMNILVIYGEDILSAEGYSLLVDAMWGFTLINLISGWILPLILLIYLKDKGIQYKKWIILYWILNFIVFITGVCNPIPQSV